MVICYQDFSDLLWEKIVLVMEKNFWNSRICKIFEITRTIYSNSQRSEQFLKQNVFLTCYWMFHELEQIKIKLEKIIGIQKPTGKVRKRIDHIPIASFSCLTSARNSECPGENLAFSPLSYWWIVCSEAEAGRGWQSASQIPLRPRSQWISFGDAIQSRRSETRSTAFSDTATISSWNVNEQKTL